MLYVVTSSRFSSSTTGNFWSACDSSAAFRTTICPFPPAANTSFARMVPSSSRRIPASYASLEVNAVYPGSRYSGIDFARSLFQRCGCVASARISSWTAALVAINHSGTTPPYRSSGPRIPMAAAASTPTNVLCGTKYGRPGPCSSRESYLPPKRHPLICAIKRASASFLCRS